MFYHDVVWLVLPKSDFAERSSIMQRNQFIDLCQESQAGCDALVLNTLTGERSL